MRKWNGSRLRGDGRRVRRALRAAGWNAVLIAVGLALLVGAGELWLRSTVPFMTSSTPRAFVPGVGLVGRPGAEVRATNRLDFWQVSRFNREGFLDREPPRAESAADTCHVTVIGDSFVEAREVPVAAKLHVRLEALAARRPGSLNVTTSAFGRVGTGQINQLAWYDEFARKRAPGLIVLVFSQNDYVDNSPLLTAVRQFRDPDRLVDMTAERAADGALRLRPPNPDFEGGELIRRLRRGRGITNQPRIGRYVRAVTGRAARWSYFGGWVHAMTGLRLPRLQGFTPRQIAWADALRKKHPDAPLLDVVARREWPAGTRFLPDLFAADPLPEPYAAELEYTAFALEQFRQRADRDGASLVILATHHLRPGEPLFDRMRAIADELRIPVVSLYDHIVRRGGRVRDAHWRRDMHWTPAGHQWAAEALLEHLRRHPDTCARGPRSRAAGATSPREPGHVRARTAPDANPCFASKGVVVPVRGAEDVGVEQVEQAPLLPRVPGTEHLADPCWLDAEDSGCLGRGQCSGIHHAAGEPEQGGPDPGGGARRRSAPACAGPSPAPTPSPHCAAAGAVAASRTSGSGEPPAPPDGPRKSDVHPLRRGRPAQPKAALRAAGSGGIVRRGRPVPGVPARALPRCGEVAERLKAAVC